VQLVTTWTRISRGGVDAAGLTAVLCALATALWLTQLDPGSARAELADIRVRQLELQTDHSRLQRARQQAEDAIREQLAGAEAEGLIHGTERINDWLSAARQMAEAHGWRDVSYLPLADTRAQRYVEHRFAVSATARFADVLAMLVEFERSPHSAGISHLGLRPLDAAEPAGMGLCSVDLILDLYELVPSPGEQSEQSEEAVSGRSGDPGS
jgi:hypothetical protein